MTCRECGKDYRPADTCPLVRRADGTVEHACRWCVTGFLADGYLPRAWPFWARQAGLDTLPDALGHARTGLSTGQPPPSHRTGNVAPGGA